MVFKLPVRPVVGIDPRVCRPVRVARWASPHRYGCREFDNVVGGAAVDPLQYRDRDAAPATGAPIAADPLQSQPLKTNSAGLPIRDTSGSKEGAAGMPEMTGSSHVRKTAASLATDETS